MRSSSVEEVGRAVRVARDLEGLDALAPAWDALAARAASPMQGFAWARAGAVALAEGRRLHVMVAGRAPDVAVAALVERSGRLELLGAEELEEPHDVLAADADALAQLAEGMRRSGRPVFLKRVPSESPFIGALRAAYQGRGLVICRPQAPYPWIPIDRSWTDPERRFNAGRRSDFRRARRIAEAIGPVRAQLSCPAPDDVEPLVDEALGVEAAGWKGRLGSALVCDASRQRFFRRYAASASRLGILRMAFLRIGGRAVAMQLGVQWAGRLWLLKIGYDEAFARCSPGTLLMLEVLRDAAARGLSSVEFLGMTEPWTRVWTARERTCVSLRAYPRSGAAARVFLGDVARIGWRRLGRPAAERQRRAALAAAARPSMTPREDMA